MKVDDEHSDHETGLDIPIIIHSNGTKHRSGNFLCDIPFFPNGQIDFDNAGLLCRAMP